jgi:tRNA1(Val) A37 N6-methylase TrmN6
MSEPVTEDFLLDGRVRLAQPSQGFRAGIDAVFLAASVRAKTGEKVLDVGCGSGAAALCLAARVDGALVTGLDRDRALVRLASTNAEANGCAGRVQFFLGDLLSPPIRLAAASFDHVMANPPYRPPGYGRPPQQAARAEAMIEDRAALEDWLRFCLMMVRHNGSVTLIYSADRLDALLVALAGRLGDISIYPLWPGGGSEVKPAKRVIVSGRRASQAPLSLLPGLVLHRTDGHFTDAAEAVLRHGQPISW